MAESESRVEIGYLEKTEPFRLESRFFPSKVGGRPAWLDLKNLPVDVSCGVCRKPCIFLCQIYAPIDEQIDTYHRTIFIFTCRNPDCCDNNKNNNFVVFRCQLRKENNYYVPEEPDDTPEWHPECKIDRFTSTCIVCGCKGSFQCGKCKTAKYCSKDHQVLDWKSGHNETCGSSNAVAASLLFHEYEIITEPEILDDDEQKLEEKSEQEKLRDYNELLSQGKTGTLSDVPDSVLEQYAESKEDKYFNKFKARLSLAPDQVVRYERGGHPLWITKPNLTESESESESVPKCETCQAPRQFEFQILPTLLNYLNVDSLEKSIDWGTLLVYTCKENCSEGLAYKREFLWKQDV